MHKLFLNKKFIITTFIGIIQYLLLFFSEDPVIVQGMFVVFITSVYIMQLPKELMNPKNIVFGFYFMWYGVAPIFANRYATLANQGILVVKAYQMLATTYIIAMITLDFMEQNSDRRKHGEHREKIALTHAEYLFLLISYASAILIYIYRTGGLAKWLTNANDAFFSRGGSGAFYLIFEYSLFLLLYFVGKKKAHWLQKVFFLFLCVVTMFFCGSKSIALVLALMFLNEYVMDIKLLNGKSILIIAMGCIVFVIGMYIREGAHMQSFEAIISTCLNYFDTLDEFLILLKDFAPDIGETIFLPLNWIFMKFGISISERYYDTSIWLTTIYYPESWANGGTHQWPMEAYLYLNFKYVYGIALVIIYFAMIGYIFQKAKVEHGIWRFIYLSELMSIISHLRGGLFNYWYIYLLPFYIVLLIIEKRINGKVVGDDSQFIRNEANGKNRDYNYK